jgi:REP element-mobilizing transposase RayT
MNGDIIKFKNKYRAESARREGYDYSQAGCYFVTICAKNKKIFFGDVLGSKNEAKIALLEIGKIANKFWLEIPKYFLFVKLYEHIIMPNHVHGVIEIDREDDDIKCKNNIHVRSRDAINRVSTNDVIAKQHNPMGKGTLGEIIRWYKGRCSFEINKLQNNIDFAWQSRFYDRIIRNEDELGKIREYIVNNPLKWELDKNSPENLFM